MVSRYPSAGWASLTSTLGLALSRARTCSTRAPHRLGAVASGRQPWMALFFVRRQGELGCVGLLCTLSSAYCWVACGWRPMVDRRCTSVHLPLT
jgi:hypothetical protein